MDWDRMCKDPSIWLTDEERNPAKRHVNGTDVKPSSWNVHERQPCIATNGMNA
jgi:hypothetical protein